MPSTAGNPAWPELPLAGWDDTRATLHLWTQIVGKTRLALAPMENHWWQVALYLTARGLTTSPMPAGARSLEVELDFVDHRLLARTSDGATAHLDLAPRTVAEFYAEYLELLAGLGVAPRIWPRPVEIPGDPPAFDRDREHAAYDAAAVERFFRALARADRVLKAFRGRFLGKSSPSHFWWGSFDLACTRFSGRPAPVHPGGIPGLADRVTREAYSHECISAGWWPGTPGVLEEPAFYVYAYPVPEGCAEARVRPGAARYEVELGEWILPYEAVRSSADPDATLLEFLESTYAAAAELAGWDRSALERPPAS